MNQALGYYRWDPHAVPGRPLGIWAFVLSFFVPPLAIVFGVVGLMQSRRAKVSNNLAVAALILSPVFIIAGTITTIAIWSAGGFVGK